VRDEALDPGRTLEAREDGAADVGDETMPVGPDDADPATWSNAVSHSYVASDRSTRGRRTSGRFERTTPCASMRKKGSGSSDSAASCAFRSALRAAAHLLPARQALDELGEALRLLRSAVAGRHAPATEGVDHDFGDVGRVVPPLVRPQLGLERLGGVAPADDLLSARPCRRDPAVGARREAEELEMSGRDFQGLGRDLDVGATGALGRCRSSERSGHHDERTRMPDRTVRLDEEVAISSKGSRDELRVAVRLDLLDESDRQIVRGHGRAFPDEVSRPRIIARGTDRDVESARVDHGP